MTVSAVIFDWGGTLTPRLDVELADMWVLAAKHLAPDRADEVAAALFEVDERCWSRTATDQQAFTTGQIIAQASAELGLDVGEALLEEAATHHLDQWTPHITHETDAAPTLAALRSQGLRIGLLSNTHWPRTFHEHFLERDGLAELIDVRCYTSELERTKPHPAAFRAVLQQLDVRGDEAVFVGDRLYDDIFGASSLGMRTVLRRQRDMPPYDIEPDAEIDRLPELIPLVDAWLSN